MKVVKVLNNSLLLALDAEGREIILMGKGIGYQKAIGHELDGAEVEKVFVVQDKDLSRNIIRLAAEVDELYFSLAKSIVDYAIETHGFVIMDHLYLALTDHLAFAMKRHQDGLLLQNYYAFGMWKFNPLEYDVGQYALKLIARETGVVLPKDEAYNIAFHFINGQVSSPNHGNQIEVAKIVSAILSIIRFHFNCTFDEDSFDYTRLLTHLRLFALRLLTNEQVTGQDDFLYRQIADLCSGERACVDKIAIYIRSTLGKEMTFNEMAYLIIYIHRIVVNRMEEEAKAAAAAKVEAAPGMA